jgi:hypothetical protein
MIALLASALYWRVRPAIVANQFARAIAEKDYMRADTLVRRRSGLESFSSRSKNAETLEMKVSWQKPSWRDWLAGRRRGSGVTVRASDGMVMGSQFLLTATATSIDISEMHEVGGFQYQFSSKLDDWVEYFQK